MNFLNIHTHSIKNQENEENIYNVIIPNEWDDIDFQFNSSSKYSLGIHPWYIADIAIDEQLEILKKWATHSSVQFIGEIGLDRLKGASLPMQEKVFIQQIRIAEELKKPIIIHCVRCFSELVSINKIIRPKVPLIVHGYNANATIAKTLIERGFYLSFGVALLQEQSNAQKIFSTIPIDKIFLETDDSAISIQEIYKKASFLKNISENDLKYSIFTNYSKVINL